MHLTCAAAQGYGHELRLLGVPGHATLPADPGPGALEDAMAAAEAANWSEVRARLVAVWAVTRDVVLAEVVEQLDRLVAPPAYLDPNQTVKALIRVFRTHRETRDPGWLRVYGPWLRRAALRDERLWIVLLAILERNADARLDELLSAPVDDVPHLREWAAERGPRWVAEQRVRALTPAEQHTLERLVERVRAVAPLPTRSLDLAGLFAAVNPVDPGPALVLADALAEAGQVERAAFIQQAVARKPALPARGEWTALLGPVAALFARTGTKLTHGVVTQGCLVAAPPREDHGILDDPGWHAIHTLRIRTTAPVAWCAHAPRLERLIVEETLALQEIPVLPTVRTLCLPAIQRQAFQLVRGAIGRALPNLERIEARVRTTTSPLPGWLATLADELAVELKITR
jgi:hypothetical protein